MEGTVTAPRTPRPKKPKSEKGQSKKQAFDEPKEEYAKSPIKPDPTVKREPAMEPGMLAPATPLSSAIPLPQQYSLTTVAPADLALSGQAPPQVIGYSQPPIGSIWNQVKKEDPDREVIMTDVYVKRELQN